MKARKQKNGLHQTGLGWTTLEYSHNGSVELYYIVLYDNAKGTHGKC